MNKCSSNTLVKLQGLNNDKMKGKFDTIIDSSTPVLVDFFAEWCGPCKTQSAILKELSSSIDGKARIIKIDVDKNQNIAGRFNVRNIPTLMLFKNGKELWKKAGVSSVDELKQLISAHQ